MSIKIGNISITLLINFRNAYSILYQSLATRMVNNNPQAIWVRETTKPQLRTFSNAPIQIDGRIQTRVTSNGWHTPAAMFTVVVDGLKPLISAAIFLIS